MPTEAFSRVLHQNGERGYFVYLRMINDLCGVSVKDEANCFR